MPHYEIWVTEDIKALNVKHKMAVSRLDIAVKRISENNNKLLLLEDLANKNGLVYFLKAEKMSFTLDIHPHLKSQVIVSYVAMILIITV